MDLRTTRTIHIQIPSFGTKTVLGCHGNHSLITGGKAADNQLPLQNDQVEAQSHRADRLEPTSSIGQYFTSSFPHMQHQEQGLPRWNNSSPSQSLSERDIPPTFPQQLMEVLSNESLSNIITWLPHGQGWIILDKTRFASEVLPQYFEKKSKWTSFTRKLNRWNFTRVTRGEEVGSYYHPLFQRDNKHLSMQMTCMGSRVPQSLEPLNPVALGLATPKMIEHGLLHDDKQSGRHADMDQRSQLSRERPSADTRNAHATPTAVKESQLYNAIPTASSSMTYPIASSLAPTNIQSQQQLEATSFQQFFQQPLDSNDRSQTPDADRLTGADDEFTLISPNPLAPHIDSYFQHQQEQKVGALSAISSSRQSSGRDQFMGELYSEAVGQRTFPIDQGFPFDEDTLTMTPAHAITTGGSMNRHSRPQQQREELSVTSQAHHEDRCEGSVDFFGERQKINPRIFDTSSSVLSISEDPRTNNNEQTTPQAQQLSWGRQDTKADDTPQLDDKASAIGSVATVEGYGGEYYMQYQQMQHQHPHQQGQRVMEDSVASLRDSYMAAVMMMDKKNHGLPGSIGGCASGSPSRGASYQADNDFDQREQKHKR